MHDATERKRARGLARSAAAITVLAASPALAAAAGEFPAVFGIPVDFILFALTLIGVAVFHRHTLQVALTGLAVIVVYKLGFTGFKTGAGFDGLVWHLHARVGDPHEPAVPAASASRCSSNHFEKSHVPDVLPRFLPDDWKGCFVLLVMIFVLSSFLDNIAAALIGGTIAATVFRRQGAHRLSRRDRRRIQRRRRGQRRGRHHHDHDVDRRREPARTCCDAYVAAAVALVVFGIPAALQQQRYSPIMKDEPRHARGRLGARRHRRGHPRRGDR